MAHMGIIKGYLGSPVVTRIFITIIMTIRIIV